MWRLSDAELNCVSTKMLRRSACRQLLTGTSISRYLPPIGTAGFERVCVRGKRRAPCPPPKTIPSTSFIVGRRRTIEHSEGIASVQGRRTFRSFDEAVAHPNHGFDLPPGRAKFAPEPAHVHVHRTGLHL